MKKKLVFICASRKDIFKISTFFKYYIMNEIGISEGTETKNTGLILSTFLVGGRLCGLLTYFLTSLDLIFPYYTFLDFP